MRCLLIGNYGVGNLGDELLQEYFLERFPKIEWQVVSAHPTEEALPRLPGGIRSFLSFNWRPTLQAMRCCDAVVFGGGTLLADYESPRACFLWWLHARVARFFGKPVLFVFQGVGPFTTRIGEWFAGQALQGIAFLSVRDEASALRAEKLGSTTKIVQSFDPIFSLYLEKKVKYRSTNVSKDLLIVIPRRHGWWDIEIALRPILSAEPDRPMRIVSMQPDDPKEEHVCQELLRRYPGAKLRPVRTMEELLGAIADGAAVLSQRYHGTLAAMALGKEIITPSQIPGDKHESLRSLPWDEAGLQVLDERVKEGETALREALGRLRHAR